MAKIQIKYVRKVAARVSTLKFINLNMIKEIIR